MNWSALMLLIASLEGIIHNLNMLLFLIMMDYGMLRELDLRFIIEGMTLMKSRLLLGIDIKFIVIVLILRLLIRRKLIYLAIESRCFDILCILSIHPRIFILVYHHLASLNISISLLVILQVFIMIFLT